MLDINVLNSEYKKYNLYKTRFHMLKKEKWNFYKENQKEIDKLYREYQDISDQQESRDFQFKHKVLRTHLILEYLVQRYKFAYREVMNLGNAFPKNECILAVKDDQTSEFYLLDLNTGEKLDLLGFDKDKVYFIIEGLTRVKSFIGYANNGQLPLVEVIKQDIGYKYGNGQKKVLENMAAEIGLDLLKATVFDAPRKDKKTSKQEEKYLIKQKQNRQKFDNGKISIEEYFITNYYYAMLISHDVEGIYNAAPDDKKIFVLEAYFRLSSYTEITDEHPYHERTCSPLINKEVLKRKYKKTE